MNFNSNKGTAAVITAVMMTAILGFCALVVDVGSASLEKNKLQSAVDAAVLAAAQDLTDTSAAAATANEYLSGNGFEDAVIDVSFAESNRQVTIEATHVVSYSFAGIFGIDSADVKASATAQKGGTYQRGAFDYAVFSGSRNDELSINSNGQATYIQGSVHSNNGFRYNGNHDPMVITGILETVRNITINSDHATIGEQMPYSSHIDMPDFSDEILHLAQTVGTYYNTNKIFNNDININEAIYVNGHVHFNCNKFSGVGTIMAKEDIIFNNSVVYESPDSTSICIYSENGDIIINNTSAVVNGTFYAPNGTVIFNNGAHTIHGRVIAKRLIFNGGIEVYSSPGDTVFMESFDDGIRLVR